MFYYGPLCIQESKYSIGDLYKFMMQGKKVQKYRESGNNKGQNTQIVKTGSSTASLQDQKDNSKQQKKRANTVSSREKIQKANLYYHAEMTDISLDQMSLSVDHSSHNPSTICLLPDNKQLLESGQRPNRLWMYLHIKELASQQINKLQWHPPISSNSTRNILLNSPYPVYKSEILYYSTKVNIPEQFTKNKLRLYDYSLIQLVKKPLKAQEGFQTVKKLLSKLKLANAEKLNKSFLADATIYGFADELPEYYENLLDWKRWKVNKSIVIKSQGKLTYINNQLQYKFSAFNGMVGSPITVSKGNQLYVIGIHICGNQYNKTNYGILFQKSFFDFIIKQVYYQIKPSQIQKIISVEINLCQKIQSLEQKEKFSSICQYSWRLLNKLREFEQVGLFIKSLSMEDIIIEDNGRLNFRKIDLVDFSLRPLSSLAQRQLEKLNLDCFYSIYRTLAGNQQIMNKFQSQSDANNIQLKVPNCIKSIRQIMRYQQQKTQKNTYIFPKNPILHLIFIINCLQQNYLDKNKMKNQHNIGKTVRQRFNQQYTKDSKYQISFEYFQKMVVDEYKINISLFRKNTLFLYKYSKVSVNISIIVKKYILHLTKLFQKIIHSYEALIKLPQKQKKHYIHGVKNTLTTKLKQLKKLTFKKDYAFSLWNIGNDSKIFQERLQIYRQLFADISQKQKIIPYLVKYQIFFYDRLHNEQLQAEFKILDSYILNYLIFQELQKQQLAIQKPEQKSEHYLGINLQKIIKEGVGIKVQQRNQGRKFSSSLDIPIFQDLFCYYEKQASWKSRYTSFRQDQFKDLRDLIVDIRSSAGTPLGTGFLVHNRLICTSMHLFDNLSSSIVKCKIYQKNQEVQVDIKDHYRKKLINRQYRDEYDDLIFLQLNKQVFTIKQLEILTEESFKSIKQTKCFALLLGCGLVDKQTNKTQIFKSFGQIQLGKSNFHSLHCDFNFSGSPILIKVGQDFKILGVYKGEAKIQGELIGTYTKIKLQKFKNETIDIFKEFRMKTFECSVNDKDKIRSAIKNYLILNYTTLDHFLLIILAQLLRLNQLNFYVHSLSFNDLVLGSSKNRSIKFPNLKLIDNSSQNYLEKFQERRDKNQENKIINQAKTARAYFKLVCEIEQILNIEQQKQNIQPTNQFVNDSIIIQKVKKMMNLKYYQAFGPTSNIQQTVVEQVKNVVDFIIEQFQKMVDLRQDQIFEPADNIQQAIKENQQQNQCLINVSKPLLYNLLQLIDKDYHIVDYQLKYKGQQQTKNQNKQVETKYQEFIEEQNKHQRHFIMKTKKRLERIIFWQDYLKRDQPGFYHYQQNIYRYFHIHTHLNNDIGWLAQNSKQPADGGSFSYIKQQIKKQMKHLIKLIQDQDKAEYWANSEPFFSNIYFNKATYDKFVEQICNQSTIWKYKKQFIDYQTGQFDQDHILIRQWTNVSQIKTLYRLIQELQNQFPDQINV